MHLGLLCRRRETAIVALGFRSARVGAALARSFAAGITLRPRASLRVHGLSRERLCRSGSSRSTQEPANLAGWWLLSPPSPPSAATVRRCIWATEVDVARLSLLQAACCLQRARREGASKCVEPAPAADGATASSADTVETPIEDADSLSD